MTKSAKEVMAEASVSRYNHKDSFIQYEMRKCGKLSFVEGFDACLKHLAESGDWFDPITLKDAFVSADPSEIAIEPLYRWGARYQHSRDQLVIQALREEIEWRKVSYDKLDDVNISLNEKVIALEDEIVKLKGATVGSK